MWQAVATSGGATLLHDASGRYLHAISSCLPCFMSVCISTCGIPCRARQWAVEAVPRISGRQWLLVVTDDGFFNIFCQGLALVCHPLPPSPTEREIRWALADDSGNVTEERWAAFRYAGSDAYQLERKLVNLLPRPRISCRLTLCIRASHHGQLSPLMIDLPQSRE